MKTSGADNAPEALLLSADGGGFLQGRFRRYVDSLLKTARTDPPAVLASVNRLLPLARASGDSKSTGMLFRMRAHALRAMSQPARARADYEEAITHFRRSGHEEEVAVTRIGLIDALMYLGRYEEARRAAVDARRWFNRTGDLVRSARAETNLGNIFHRLDEPGKALARYDAARRVFARRSDPKALALVDFNRGNVLAILGRTRAARTAYGSAAALFRRSGETSRSAQVRYNAAYLSYLENRLPTALEELEDVRPVFEEMKDGRHVALTRLDESEILLRLHLWTDAAAAAREARDRFDEIRMDYEKARAELFLGVALARQGNSEESRKELSAALRGFEKEGNRAWQCESLLRLGDLALAKGRWREAAGRARSALDIAARLERPGLSAAARLLEARAERGAGRKARARRAVDLALREAVRARSPWIQAEARELLGILARENGDPAGARRHLRRSIAILESIRLRLSGDDLKAGFLRDRDHAYQELAALELTRGRPRAAFEVLERGRSRALLDMLSGASRRPGNRPMRRLAERLLEELGRHYHRTALADTGQARWAMPREAETGTLSVMESRAAAVLRRLDARKASGRGAPAVALGLEEVQAALQGEETLLVFFEMGRELGVFEITGNRLAVHRGIASLDALERDLLSLRFGWGRFRWTPELLERHRSQVEQIVRSDLGRLHDRILGWEGAASRKRPILVVPTASLRSVPFSALHDGELFACQKRPVSVIPSASVLVRLRAGQGPRPVTGGPVVLVGVADSRAPEVSQEIRDLERLFPDAVTLRGREATAEALRRSAPGARILHLATHGLFRTDRPQFSGLRLSDRWVYGYDISEWPLRAELVTLSACVTGLTEAWGTGEWMGLSRALLSAGARRVLVGLWDVDDGATRQLMRHFYQSLTGPDAPLPSEALARAQAGMAASGWHPYFWSGFSLIGDL